MSEKLEMTKYEGLMWYLYPKSCYDKNSFECDKYCVHAADKQADGVIAYLGMKWEIKLAL